MFYQSASCPLRPDLARFARPMWLSLVPGLAEKSRHKSDTVVVIASVSSLTTASRSSNGRGVKIAFLTRYNPERT